MYLQPLVPSAEAAQTLTSQEKPPTHHQAGMKSPEAQLHMKTLKKTKPKMYRRPSKNQGDLEHPKTLTN